MISADDMTKKKENTHPPSSGNDAQEKRTGDSRRTTNKQNCVRKAGSQSIHRYQTARPSKESKALYAMVIGACVLLVGSLALYISTATRKPWSPALEGGGAYVPTSVSEPKVSRTDQLPPPAIIPRTKESVPALLRYYAVVDVPDLGLRNVPDLAMKAASSGLKRGERVEIVRRISGKGPGWIKIRTKSGKAGWVIASLVKERKGR